mgnify:CR=1 FL=1
MSTKCKLTTTFEYWRINCARLTVTEQVRTGTRRLNTVCFRSVFNQILCNSFALQVLAVSIIWVKVHLGRAKFISNKPLVFHKYTTSRHFHEFAFPESYDHKNFLSVLRICLGGQYGQATTGLTSRLVTSLSPTTRQRVNFTKFWLTISFWSFPSVSN